MNILISLILSAVAAYITAKRTPEGGTDYLGASLTNGGIAFFVTFTVCMTIAILGASEMAGSIALNLFSTTLDWVAHGFVSLLFAAVVAALVISVIIAAYNYIQWRAGRGDVNPEDDQAYAILTMGAGVVVFLATFLAAMVWGS